MKAVGSIRVLVLAMLSWATPALSQVAPASPGAAQPAAPSTRMVLIGASYAADWGTPALPGFRVTNMGRGGHETSQVLARFDTDVIASKPEVVLIWGHINDIFRAPNGDMAAAATRATRNLTEMTSRASQAGIRVIIATEVTLNRPEGFMEWLGQTAAKVRGKQTYQERINHHVRVVNDFVRSHAREKGFLLLDFEKVFDDGSGFRKSSYARENDTHISAAGYAALTDYTKSRLKSETRT
jgi:lysophospholipase L1-like esterase